MLGLTQRKSNQLISQVQDLKIIIISLFLIPAQANFNSISTMIPSTRTRSLSAIHPQPVSQSVAGVYNGRVAVS